MLYPSSAVRLIARDTPQTDTWTQHGFCMFGTYAFSVKTIAFSPVRAKHTIMRPCVVFLCGKTVEKTFCPEMVAFPALRNITRKRPLNAIGVYPIRPPRTFARLRIMRYAPPLAIASCDTLSFKPRITTTEVYHHFRHRLLTRITFFAVFTVCAQHTPRKLPKGLLVL